LADPADGPARPEGQEGDQEVLGIELAPHAEGPAHVHLQEMHAVLGQPHVLGDDAAIPVRHLGHAPHAEHPPAGVVFGDSPAGLHGDRRVPLDGQALADDDVGLLEGSLDVAASDRVGGHDVRRLGLEQ
jgi:hypothetical protein